MSPKINFTHINKTKWIVHTTGNFSSNKAFLGATKILEANKKDKKLGSGVSAWILQQFLIACPSNKIQASYHAYEATHELVPPYHQGLRLDYDSCITLLQLTFCPRPFALECSYLIPT